MAVAFDAVSSTSGSGTSLSWTHTPSGTPTAVAVGCYYWQVASGPATQITGVTYNGVAMTLASNDFDGTGDEAALYGLANPPSGAQTVVISFAASVFPVAGAITVTGSDTTTCFSNNAATHGTSAAPSVSVTSAIGELVVDVMGEDSSTGDATPGGSQTGQWQQTNGGLRGEGSTQAGAASVTMSWSLPGSTNWAIAAASFKAAAGGGGGTNILMGQAWL